MITLNYTIKDKQGLHARTSGFLVKKANEMKSKVVVKKGNRIESARDIFGVMRLGAKKGEEIQIIIEGENEEKDVEKMKKFLMEYL